MKYNIIRIPVFYLSALVFLLPGICKFALDLFIEPSKRKITVQKHITQKSRGKTHNIKLKSQNTEVTSYEHRIQNICTRNTMSHIEARARVGRPQTSSSPSVNCIAGRPNAALLFWFFGDFRCGT